MSTYFPFLVQVLCVMEFRERKNVLALFFVLYFIASSGQCNGFLSTDLHVKTRFSYIGTGDGRKGEGKGGYQVISEQD